MPDQEKIFVDGMYFEKREGAPSFVLGSLSIKVAELVSFLQMHEKKSGYVNVDIKQSKGGKYYCELNIWQPPKIEESKSEEISVPTPEGVDYPEGNSEEIPF